ncbi:MAG: MarR family transcriptional regulator [Clostridiales bacterium]|nr:MarR family transcriptional regulator [Clostridiales bacterium]
MLGNINSETMRATNLQVIFDYIRRNEPASRRDIAEFGGLTVAAVSNITSKLLANGLVVEVGAGQARQVAELFTEQDFELVRIIKDYADTERHVLLRKKG